ncbi:hypothetical protein BST81_00930 [Leptolyngbya sp. 'hensonii']|uniref:ATP-binding protein n=1 Tax=Leptolyngbya sp. 'hensonii' TaxID=1922337 RepID=UPI00094F62C2|nr:ATP-binding protein [Leptolyngbya sp. 'hensonii']OLP20332.1 hypothetical protein BST81_00930 [Leptolyngbya sp. 'hensonii']
MTDDSLESFDRVAAQYYDLFEHLVEGIFRTTPAGQYLHANAALAKLYGYVSPDALVSALTDIEHQLYVDPDRRREFMALLEDSEMIADFESCVYCQDGQTIWISENARGVRDETGRIIYYEGTVKNITKRKLAEQALGESEAKYRILFNAIPDLMLRLHRDGTYLDFKPPTNFQTYFKSPDQCIGKNVRDLLPPANAQLYLQAVEEVIQTGKMKVFEFQLPIEGQSRDYEARFVASGVDEALGIIRNITERKRVERLKNEFVSVVSHELRTPLTSIRGSLGLIIGGIAGEISAQARELIDIAHKNSERLVLLINDILDVEKIESGKMHFEMKPLALVPLVEQAIVANQAYGEQFKVQFVLEHDLTEVKINGDSNRLMQVMANLLSNAAKFSPPGSTVEVTVRRKNLETVRVTVRDHGPGIPEEFRYRIFQKFAQADTSTTRQKGGTGLGLSISKAIVERLGGTIGFETEMGVGTAFYFELPMVTQAPAMKLSAPGNQPPILICEDNQDVATLLSLILQHSGYQTDIAYDAATAKRLLAEKQYVAATVDLILPDQDGLSLIRELRKQESTRFLPIVVVSAIADQEREELSGSTYAVIDCLDKPIDQERLLAAVQQALCQKTGTRAKILHVEDDPDILQVVSRMLQAVADTIPALCLREAIQHLSRETFDLVILDLNLPDGFGLEVLPYLSSHTGVAIPVVVFSAQEMELEAARKVTASLVKSRTSNQELLDTIKALIHRSIPEAAIESEFSL